jgi:predicted dehydrogenase
VVNRRDFLGSTLGATLAASAYAEEKKRRVGLIGCGWYGKVDLVRLMQAAPVEVVSLCDVDRKMLADAADMVAQRQASKKKPRTYTDYRELLKQKDVDAVLIGTPDHWHVPLTVAACAAGKDVYVEKPLTHDLTEGKAVIEAVNRSKRIVQVGMQQRSMPQIRQARERLKAGRVGKVIKVHMTWNRNTDRVRRTALNIDPKTVDWTTFLGSAREQPFDDYRFRNWRWFWDFGGGLFTDLMVHWVDVAHWLLDLDHPLRAVSVGTHVTSKGVWETPDTVQTVLVYPGDVQIYFEGTFGNARNGAMIEFMGGDGTLYVDRGRYEIIPDWNKKVPPEELVLGSGRRGADFYDRPDGELLHLTNWVECVRSRKTPNAPVEAGVSAAAAAHLANKALRSGQTAEWPA